jgi:hypothetical protein
MIDDETRGAETGPTPKILLIRAEKVLQRFAKYASRKLAV